MTARLVAALFFLCAVSVHGDDACKNDADLNIYEAIKGNLSAIQKTCILEGAPGADWTQHCLKRFTVSQADGEKCMSNCVHLRANLSESCSDCFGSISGCVYKNCVMQCLDAKSQGCIDCGKQYCDADFLKCTGLPDLPPAQAFDASKLVVV